MNAYGKYSNLVENTLGLGRNGKRIAHGAAVGGGVWAAGRYGGVEVINNNMPVAIGAGVVGGTLLTVAMDAMWLDSAAEAEMLSERIKHSSPETQARLLAEAESLFGKQEEKPEQKATTKRAAAS
jgi:hypothetical protein